MMVHGDPNKRGADHGEAFGASLKDDIHHRCLCRRQSTQRVEHKRRDAEGRVVKTWTQAGLGMSRIAQVWRDVAVRSRLLREEESADYLQRRHFTLAKTGFATGGQAAAARHQRHADGSRSVYELVAESRGNA